MPICSNPRVRNIGISVGEATVVLVLRHYSTEEYTRFMSERFRFRGTGRIEDRSMQARVEFVDKLLVDLRATNAEGVEEEVTYFDEHSGEEKKLSPEVERWKEYVNPSWKIAAALQLEHQAEQEERTTLKN